MSHLPINFLQHLKTEPGWKYLPLDRISQAQQLQSQKESWSCGPHSGYRALILNGDEKKGSNNGLADFIRTCPKSVGSPQTNRGKKIMTAANFLTRGISTVAMKGLDSIGGNVGPTPGKLASHINPKSRSSVKKYHCSSWQQVWPQIQRDIDRNSPCIILLEFSWRELHYINLVGYNSKTQKVAILDTNNSVEVWTVDYFKYVARIKTIYCGEPGYQIIRFY
ncbi:hypothetical protein [Phormidium sp. CCY1219]|uniref:hypothetical protein n=1 Tax=Phormidium sp. CCY1219 TaxID=2886104 RepID=UPI002D1EB214|nr:hypothetical protein [Phormidium sp. CCY1219]MEB3829030.1 hypothetical protein [Phormidium sp. CCY1219]